MLHCIHSSSEDLPFIFHLFSSAIAYQKKHGYELWPEFGRELIEREIIEKRHWKIVQNGEILCVFSVMYNDPVIWAERDVDPSVYLHRIAVNPLFKGKKFVEFIKTWAISHARENNKLYVRMDTWGKNENLRKYYISCGFHYLGQQFLVRKEGEPEHYGGSELSLFEIPVTSGASGI